MCARIRKAEQFSSPALHPDCTCALANVTWSAFVENGADVYISSRKADACARTADELNAAGPGRCVALVGADLGSPEGCAALVEDLGQRVDALHVLINNSGTTWGEPFASYPDKAFERCFSLNVTAPFRLTRALLPLLDKASAAEDPARVINIGSIAGLTPQPIPAFACACPVQGGADA